LHDTQTSVNGVLMVNADLCQTVRVKDVRAFNATSQKSRSRQREKLLKETQPWLGHSTVREAMRPL
jgi:hypothetical protein